MNCKTVVYCALVVSVIALVAAGNPDIESEPKITKIWEPTTAFESPCSQQQIWVNRWNGNPVQSSDFISTDKGCVALLEVENGRNYQIQFYGLKIGELNGN